MLVTKEFTFDAAHYLTKYHGQCERLHGHTYKLRVTIEGEIQENGLVLDFVILKKLVHEKVLSKFDHQNLNDFFENPTAEVMAKWIWDELVDLPTHLMAELENPNLPEAVKALLRDPENGKKELNTQVRLHKVKLWETPTSWVSYKGK